VYWNGIPFTDPGGNTYLNQLSFYNVNSIEVLKGPASSLYGVGTGGAVLINSQTGDRPAGINLHYTTGSYNLQNMHAQVITGDSDHNNTFGYTHITSDGYRDNTRMRRDVATWETLFRIGFVWRSVLSNTGWFNGGSVQGKSPFGPAGRRRLSQRPGCRSGYLSKNIFSRPYPSLPIQ
jgi:outer membrane receptor protein involved in Fe transport